MMRSFILTLHRQWIAVLFAFVMVSVQAQEYPLTIEHKYGSTVLDKQPERVATVDAAGADDLLALGIQPVAIRYWYGDFPKAVWPWAEPLLTTSPVILHKPVDAELLAGAKPDVILALWAALSPEDYEKFSEIAPVVVPPKGTADYGLNWDERALIAGRAIGKEAEAQKQVDALNQRIAEIAQAHPQWQGKTMAVAFVTKDGRLGAYDASDLRVQIFEQLGFKLAPAIAELGINSNHLSPEAIGKLDNDMLVWITSSDFSKIKALNGYDLLKVHQDGREVFLDKEVTGAFSHGSLLSLPYAIDAIVPLVEQAIDKPELQAAE